MTNNAQERPYLLIAGIVLGLVAYFLPWYAHPTVGLTLIGIDISEWIKFLPQYGAGQLPNRDFFYLPPLFLGGTAILWGGSNLFQSWRYLIPMFIGSLVTLLAFPSVDEILDPGKAPAEWRPRVIAIIITLLLGWVAAILPLKWRTLYALGTGLLFGLIALFLPFYAAILIRPIYIEWLKIEPTFGIGLWLYGVAVLLILWHAISKLIQRFQ